MIEKVVTYQLSRDERETHYSYIDGEKFLLCDTSIPKDIRRLVSKGWEMLSCDKHSDGTIIAAKFKVPVNMLTPRKCAAPKPKRVVTEERQRKMQNGRKNISNLCNIST